jgi:hypothetical protein
VTVQIHALSDSLDGCLDLASVKHRGRNRGTWSIAGLCDDGGLTHLFDRWLAVSASSASTGPTAA